MAAGVCRENSRVDFRHLCDVSHENTSAAPLGGIGSPMTSLVHKVTEGTMHPEQFAVTV
jgi:hypothetical protein